MTEDSGGRHVDGLGSVLSVNVARGTRNEGDYEEYQEIEIELAHYIVRRG